MTDETRRQFAIAVATGVASVSLAGCTGNDGTAGSDDDSMDGEDSGAMASETTEESMMDGSAENESMMDGSAENESMDGEMDSTMGNETEAGSMRTTTEST